MIEIKRTDSEDRDFQLLVAALDQDLALRNGEANDFFAQFNQTNSIRHVIVALTDGLPAGCGAMKAYDSRTMEIKRMFVPLEMRGKGIASEVLQALEEWAREMNYERSILETGDKMPEAIGLYKKSGYRVIPNYGQYQDVPSSICFEKHL